MNPNEEIEIVHLKSEMDKVGEKHLSNEKKSRYIELRRKQKAERSNKQAALSKKQSKSVFGRFGILLGFLPFIIIAIIIWMIMNIKSEDISNDCVVGQDSPDCLEGGGVGHPLWND